MYQCSSAIWSDVSYLEIFNWLYHTQYFLSLSHSVTLTISELRSEAQPFATGIVKHITTVAVVQQCCESVYYTHVHVHDNSLGVYNVIYTITNTCIHTCTCMYNVCTCFFSYRLSQSPEATVSQIFMCIYMYSLELE